jgi:betaine-aldehyde dehydrogenase
MSVRSYDRLYIDGGWREPGGSERIEVISPHTEQVIASVPDGTAADMDRAVDAARRSFEAGEWQRTPVVERIDAVERLANAYEKRVPEIAEVISAENGSPISFAMAAQAGASWLAISAFVTLARNLDWEAERPGVFVPSVTIRREPVGVVAAIVPWNVPQMVTMPKVIPALLAGCSVVLKPSPETPLDAYLLAELIDEIGLPAGVFNMLPGGREAGQHLVSHPDVDKVAFTGSTAAGRTIARICGEQLKRCSLELGGKSAAVVLDDADLGVVTQGLKLAAIINSGQGCTNQTRVLASRTNYANVLDAVVETVRSMKVGEPADPTVEIGPMVSQRHQSRVQDYIALGESEGAKAVIGGTGRPAAQPTGWYVRPTVFADAHNEMRLCREEIFGPVITVIPYEDEADAVRIANDSEYGLAGSVWTTDVDRGNDIARRIRAGILGINNFTADFLAPSGGFKASGIGREFGAEGLAMYTEIKAIYPPPADGQLGTFTDAG